METEAVKESVVRGHHVYKAVWTPLIGEELPIFPEPGNVHDKRAVSVIVGHVPREISGEAYTTCDNFYRPVSLLSTLFHSFLIASDEVSALLLASTYGRGNVRPL